jgi:hypothetical protein
MYVGKNDPLPDIYNNPPYQYHKITNLVVLRKHCYELWRLSTTEQIEMLDAGEDYFIEARYLHGSDKTQFFRECNRAKQKGRSISDVIEEYFIN